MDASTGRDRDFTVVGRALAAPARSAMVGLLMDGTARPAGELARAAGVGAPAASEHLAVLAAAGLVTGRARGRHRYYALAGPEVADALEALGALAVPVPAVGFRRTREADRLAAARFCYDHLAGRLGVGLAEAWVTAGWLADPEDLALTGAGADGLRGLGVDVDGAVAARRPTTRACLDWTERRVHLAGSLGAAVGARFLAAGWVARSSGRGLRLTASGRDLVRDTWGVEPVGGTGIGGTGAPTVVSAASGRA
ncbi:ArsR/SmtB family transcription factor [Krasilnikoviella flava]|uniref:Transcriptional regulator, ArsR family n=1 Tax=Krasilnikoviella flava TaxID=526729 RepID=A0A1T5L618_9MICO|nr:winged helix-turn-helix domain-containing protein [Krasilnikoviella flava]SKC71384.1 transcriptional regulator, ArsR family [Krasilnikoviella flava]